VLAARCRATNQQRRLQVATLHFLGDHDHLIERRRDEPRKTDDVGVALRRFREDPIERHHHAQIDDVIAVTAEHDADDVLADVMNVALDGGEEHAAVRLTPLRALAHGKPRVCGGLLSFHVGLEVRHGAFHRARALHHLRQKHLARAEQVADDLHAVHQRAFDDIQRAR
jgi:hypothetical protein